MIEIIFQKDQDAQRMFGYMAERSHAVEINNARIHLGEDKKRIKILTKNMPKAAFHRMKESIYEFIMIKKRDDWFRTILTDRFLFTDPNEQEQILEIIYSIIEGSREDLVSFLSGPDEKQFVQQAIDEIFKDSISFSFDSFVMFRLKPFHDRLNSYVEVAIDEYKLEQEYQMFVQTLREFLSAREPQYEIVHLILADEVRFFDQNLREIKRSELIKGIDRKLLGNHPVYVDSVTIAPLLSIAPEAINLYTSQPEQPLVRTIGNIFEERVKINSLADFLESFENANKKVQ